MAYASGGKLPAEMASKLGHLTVLQSEWVKTLLDNFENPDTTPTLNNLNMWSNFNTSAFIPLKYIWAVDGSFVPVSTNPPTGKEVAFIKTALLSIDKSKLERIDRQNPHPLLLQDIMSESALFHATVLPLKNVRTSLGNNYDAVRHIIFDSMQVDENGEYFETLKWLAYRKWNDTQHSSPDFSCPHCRQDIPGLSFNSDKGICPLCKKEILLTDMIGFHLDMDEESASDRIASSYMLIMEHLMLFTIVRILWNHSDKSIFSDTLFIKDGPLTLRSQYSKLVPAIREFIEYTKINKRPIHIIGQEKTGVFTDYLSMVFKHVPPQHPDEQIGLAVLSHDFVRREVYRTTDQSNPYGLRTNWGEKVLVKLDPDTAMVLNIPTGEYNKSSDFPKQDDLVGLGRILATLPELISRKYESALFPIELANGIASMSSYPSARILQHFLEKQY